LPGRQKGFGPQSSTAIGAWSRLLSSGRQATRVDIGRPEPHDARTPAARLKHIGTTAIGNRRATVIYKTLRTASRALHPRIRPGKLCASGNGKAGVLAGPASLAFGMTQAARSTPSAGAPRSSGGPGIIARRSRHVPCQRTRPMHRRRRYNRMAHGRSSRARRRAAMTCNRSRVDANKRTVGHRAAKILPVRRSIRPERATATPVFEPALSTTQVPHHPPCDRLHLVSHRLRQR
jgi:hypothetical protein